MSKLKELLAMAAPYAIIFATLNPLFAWTETYDWHPLTRILVVDVIDTLIVFAFSFFLKSSSFYDPYWQTTPIGYAILLNKLTPYAWSFRNLAIIGPILFYAIKQNIYYFRFWPGLAYEDFRYMQYVKMIKNPVLFWCFSLLSFHMFPTILVYLAITPYYYTLSIDPATQTLFQTSLVYLGSLITIASVIIEAIADEQILPWRSKKSDQCIDSGLWRYSRHPNYFGQICIWWGIFIPVLSLASPPFWTISGAIGITALFNFYSIPAMEKHLAAKRPSYRVYMQQVSRCIPMPRFKLKDASKKE